MHISLAPAQAGHYDAGQIPKALRPMSLNHALAAEQLLRRYLQYRLHECLPGAPELDDIRVVVPVRGVRSLVRIVEWGGEPQAVLRFAELKRVEEHHEVVDRLLREAEVCAPRLLDVYRLRRRGLAVLTEEFLSGRPPLPGQLRPGDPPALAALLRRLHSLRAAGLGRPEALTPANLKKRQARRLRHCLHALRRYGPPEIKGAQRREVRRRLGRVLAELPELSAYRLCHGAPNPGNLLRLHGGGFAMLDVDTMAFGHPAADLAQLYEQLFQSDPIAIARFEAAYFNEPDADNAALRRALPAFRALQELAVAAVNSRRMRLKQRENRKFTGARAKALRAWEQAFERLDEAEAQRMA